MCAGVARPPRGGKAGGRAPACVPRRRPAVWVQRRPRTACDVLASALDGEGVGKARGARRLAARRHRLLSVAEAGDADRPWAGGGGGGDGGGCLVSAGAEGFWPPLSIRESDRRPARRQRSAAALVFVFHVSPVRLTSTFSRFPGRSCTWRRGCCRGSRPGQARGRRSRLREGEGGVPAACQGQLPQQGRGAGGRRKGGAAGARRGLPGGGGRARF
jgi:hypothetical protein